MDEDHLNTNPSQAEIQTNSYLANGKLAREIEEQRPKIGVLSSLVQGPAVDEASIERLQKEVRDQ